MTAPLLGLAAAGVRNQQALVRGQEGSLDGGLLSLVRVLLHVRNEALRDGLAGGVRLRDRTTTADRHVDLQAGVLAGANGVDGLEDLGAERLRQDLLQRDAVDLDVALGRLLTVATATAVFFLPKVWTRLMTCFCSDIVRREKL